MEKLQGYKINNIFYDHPMQLGGLRLIQIGRYFCNADTLIHQHLHKDFLELTIVNEGKGTIFVNNQQIEVNKNDIFVSFPFDTHAITPDKNTPLQYDHLAFYVDDEQYGALLQEVIAQCYAPDMRIIQDSRINYLTYCLLGEFNRDRPQKTQLVQNTLYNILIYIVRAFDKKAKTNSLQHATSNEIICNRLMNYIDTNIYSIEKLCDIAQIAGYNYNYISTLFAKTTGITLRQYFLNRKLEVAHMLIAEGKLKICEIAEKLHYSSGNALTKAYKQKYGIPPKAHR